MKLILFLFFKESSKVNLNSENAIKNKQKIVDFSDNCIWIDCSKFSLLLRESSHLTLKVLTSSPKISNLTKSIFFELKLSQTDEKPG